MEFLYYYWMTQRYYIFLILPTLIFAGWAQNKVSSTFRHYSKVMSHSGMTAAEICRKLLDANGLYQIRIERIGGNLTDHYDPSSNVIRLSESVHDSLSVAAIGVAAHETGHAIQYAVGYKPIHLRAAIIPLTNFGSKISIPMLAVGFVSQWRPLIGIGILLFSTATLFQLVTLPVELDASSRALDTLDKNGLLVGEELGQAKKVLTAAAMTYVAALLTSAAELLRLVLIYGRNRDRD